MKWGSATLEAKLDGNDSPALEDKLREANRQLVQAHCALVERKGLTQLRMHRACCCDARPGSRTEGRPEGT